MSVLRSPLRAPSPTLTRPDAWLHILCREMLPICCYEVGDKKVLLHEILTEKQR